MTEQASALSPSPSIEQLLDEVDRLPHGTPAVAKLNYSHDAMIDMIIANPGIHQNTLARMLGYSASWVCTIMATDAFQVKLAERREQIIDPVLRATVEEQTRGLFLRSMEVLREKMNVDAAMVPDRLAIDVFKESAKTLGLGSRPPEPPGRDSVNEQLVRHADNLVDLLRTKRKQVAVEEAEVIPNAQSSTEQGLLPPPSEPLNSG